MIKLARETKKRVIASVRRYFAENMDDEIGDLKADLLLDFILREIGPTIYNKAIEDAQDYFQERAVDLEGTCHEVEFSYWSKS